jgi:two-component system chemotaxis response regulator CheB
MKFEQQLISKVRAAARCNPAARIRRTDERVESAAPWTPLRGNGGVEIVAIAASSGGTTALRDVVRRLPADFPAAVLIVHHTNAAFSGSLAEWLDSPTGIRVKEAESGDPIEAGIALVAPGERHMTVRRSGGENYVVLSAHPREYLYRPSIDLLFASVGEVFRRAAVAVVLSGAGNDGFEGAKIIRGNGGTVIAQEPSSSVIPDMPEAIVVAGVADVVATPDSIPSALLELVGAKCPRT